MRLYDYLQRTKDRSPGGIEVESNKDRYTRFGKQIGVSLHSIRKYINGERGIKDKTKRRIVQATEGKVKWHDLVSD